jgi:competence protein ComEC
VVIELPGGETLLYDAGRMGAPSPGADLISNFLWFRGIEYLDAVVVSHADSDHYNTLPELLERFPVGVVYVSPVMFRRASPALDRLSGAIAQTRVPLRLLIAGDRLRTEDDTCIEVLHPPRQGVPGSDNANSLVLVISHAGRRILLPGDLETPGLQQVMAELPLDCDVLMAPHHGSFHSAPREFTRWCTPQWVVISGGRNSESGHTLANFDGLGCQVFHTGYHGAVIAVVDRQHVEVGTWRD